VVDDVLVAERDAEHPLRHHRRDAVLDLAPGSAISKAGRKSGDQANRPVGRTE